MPTPEPRVFVSHSHADNDYCRTFVEKLRDSKLDVWYDEHSLGWGAIRQVVERELQSREHFVAILSPTAVTSEWVNAEIDAALFLLRNGKLKTLIFITATQCEIPLLLQRYKRIERSNGTEYEAPEAATRTLAAMGIVSSPPPEKQTEPATPIPDIKTPSDPAFELRVMKGENIGRSYPLSQKSYSIGRSPSCEIVLLNDQLTSRRHALLRCGKNGQWNIVDLGSSDGTFVNGKEIRDATPLDNDDEIQIGETSFKFHYAPRNIFRIFTN